MGALSELYEKTKKSVYGFALSVLKNPHDAEDILHDVYMQIISYAGSYTEMQKPMAWIITITRNLCFMKLRKNNRISADGDCEAFDGENVRVDVTTEDKLLLNACMQILSDEDRQIVMLHAVAGFKHRETAELLSLTLPAVLTKYNRALKKLGKFLERESSDEKQGN